MEGQKVDKHSLPHNYILNEKYKLDRVIGEGGFGITYAGICLANQSQVAVKEYFPAQFAARNDGEDTAALHVYKGDKALQFKKGMEYFMHESEILKKYSYLEGMVTVIETLEANNTAYIVMEFVEGITLARYVRENGVFSYDDLVELMSPIIKSLAQIHRQGIIHRDISPENIQIGLDNKFYLLDFGAAKNLGDNSGHNTVIFKQGYAPLEQYTGEGKYGPWTDVYAIAATMCTALTGVNMDDAVSRLQSDSPDAYLDRLGNLEDWQAAALKKALSLSISGRYQNMESFLLALTVPPSMEEQETQMQLIVSPSESEVLSARKKMRITLVVCVVLMIVIAGGAAYIWMQRNGSVSASGDTGTQAVSTAASTSEADATEKTTTRTKTGSEQSAKKSSTKTVTTESTKENTIQPSTEPYTPATTYDQSYSDYTVSPETTTVATTEAATTAAATEAATEKTTAGVTTEGAATTEDKYGFIHAEEPDSEDDDKYDFIGAE